MIEDEVPTVDDYMKTSTVSCGVPLVLVHFYFLLGQGVSTKISENLWNFISCPARILRLWDDLGSAKVNNFIIFEKLHIRKKMMNILWVIIRTKNKTERMVH